MYNRTDEKTHIKTKMLSIIIHKFEICFLLIHISINYCYDLLGNVIYEFYQFYDIFSITWHRYHCTNIRIFLYY